jgi:hypothetical protein
MRFVISCDLKIQKNKIQVIVQNEETELDTMAVELKSVQ